MSNPHPIPIRIKRARFVKNCQVPISSFHVHGDIKAAITVNNTVAITNRFVLVEFAIIMIRIKGKK